MEQQRKVFKCIFRLNGLILSGNDWDILKAKVKAYLTAQSLPPIDWTPFFISTSIVYDETKLQTSSNVMIGPNFVLSNTSRNL
jgi:hypothetical protein